MNFDKKNIICTCGSGIAACNIILALDILGFKITIYMTVHGSITVTTKIIHTGSMPEKTLANKYTSL